MENIKIAISGELGSGKTVLSSKLSSVAEMEIVSVGKIQRQLAEKYGMTTLEFNKYMETHPELDIECDDMVAKYGESSSPLILDSRMAWHFVPHSFKIHLLVNSTIAAERIYNDGVRKNEKYQSVEEARQHLIERKNSETLRFKQQYKVDIDNYSNYDLVIDTSYASPDAILEKVLDSFNKWKQNLPFNKIYLSPKSLIPTNEVKEHPCSSAKDVIEQMKPNGFPPISIIKYQNKYFIYDGHDKTNKFDFVPCVVIATDDGVLPNGQSVTDYLKEHRLV